MIDLFTNAKLQVTFFAMDSEQRCRLLPACLFPLGTLAAMPSLLHLLPPAAALHFPCRRRRTHTS